MNEGKETFIDNRIPKETDFIFTEKHLDIVLNYIGLIPFCTEFNLKDGRLWCGEYIWAKNWEEAEAEAMRFDVRIKGKLVCEVPCSDRDFNNIVVAVSSSDKTKH